MYKLLSKQRDKRSNKQTAKRQIDIRKNKVKDKKTGTRLKKQRDKQTERQKMDRLLN